MSQNISRGDHTFLPLSNDRLGNLSGLSIIITTLICIGNISGCSHNRYIPSDLEDKPESALVKVENPDILYVSEHRDIHLVNIDGHNVDSIGFIPWAVFVEPGWHRYTLRIKYSSRRSGLGFANPCGIFPRTESVRFEANAGELVRFKLKPKRLHPRSIEDLLQCKYSIEDILLVDIILNPSISEDSVSSD